MWIRDYRRVLVWIIKQRLSVRLLPWIIETIGETRGVDYEVETIRESLGVDSKVGTIGETLSMDNREYRKTVVVDCKTETVGHIIVAVYKAGTT